MATSSFMIEVNVKEVNEVRQYLSAECSATRRYPGCLDCHLEHDADQPAVICYSSHWSDEAHLRLFLASETQGRLIQFIELSRKPPEISICGKKTDMSLRYLQAIREPDEQDMDAPEPEMR